MRTAIPKVTTTIRLEAKVLKAAERFVGDDNHYHSNNEFFTDAIIEKLKRELDE